MVKVEPSSTVMHAFSMSLSCCCCFSCVFRLWHTLQKTMTIGELLNAFIVTVINNAEKLFRDGEWIRPIVKQTVKWVHRSA